MKIEILKFAPGYIEYFIDSKNPKLVIIQAQKHCIFREMFWIRRNTFHFKGQFWSGRLKRLEMFKD